MRRPRRTRGWPGSALVISRTRPRTVPSAALVASIQVSASSRCCSCTAVSRGSGPGPPPETAELALTIGAAAGSGEQGAGAGGGAVGQHDGLGLEVGGGDHRRLVGPAAGGQDQQRQVPGQRDPAGGRRGRADRRLLTVVDQRGQVGRAVEQPVAVPAALQRAEAAEPARGVGRPGAGDRAAVTVQHRVAAGHGLQVVEQRRVDREAQRVRRRPRRAACSAGRSGRPRGPGGRRPARPVRTRDGREVNVTSEVIRSCSVGGVSTTGTNTRARPTAVAGCSGGRARPSGRRRRSGTARAARPGRSA